MAEAKSSVANEKVVSARNYSSYQAINIVSWREIQTNAKYENKFNVQLFWHLSRANYMD